MRGDEPVCLTSRDLGSGDLLRDTCSYTSSSRRLLGVWLRGVWLRGAPASGCGLEAVRASATPCRAEWIARASAFLPAHAETHTTQLLVAVWVSLQPGGLSPEASAGGQSCSLASAETKRATTTAAQPRNHGVNAAISMSIPV